MGTTISLILFIIGSIFPFKIEYKDGDGKKKVWYEPEWALRFYIIAYLILFFAK